MPLPVLCQGLALHCSLPLPPPGSSIAAAARVRPCPLAAASCSFWDARWLRLPARTGLGSAAARSPVCNCPTRDAKGDQIPRLTRSIGKPLLVAPQLFSRARGLWPFVRSVPNHHLHIRCAHRWRTCSTRNSATSEKLVQSRVRLRSMERAPNYLHSGVKSQPFPRKLFASSFLMHHPLVITHIARCLPTRTLFARDDVFHERRKALQTQSSLPATELATQSRAARIEAVPVE